MGDESVDVVDVSRLKDDTLRGDIRDEILREFKRMQKPWQAMNEDEQRAQIQRAADIAGALVRKAVDLVAARGLPAIAISVGKFTVDAATVKGTYECFADDKSIVKMRHLSGQRAMFVLASPEAFNGEQKVTKPEVIGDLMLPEPDDVRADEDSLAKLGQGEAA